MRAIDTNILIRFLTSDDADQLKKARRVIKQGDIFVATTVLLETQWVLASAYDFPLNRIVEVLRDFCGLPGIVLEDGQLIARALEWAERGMDFADALHLGRAEDCSAFISFDRKLAKAAALCSQVKVVQP